MLIMASLVQNERVLIWKDRPLKLNAKGLKKDYYIFKWPWSDRIYWQVTGFMYTHCLEWQESDDGD